MTATANIANADRLLRKLRKLPDAARQQIRAAMAEQAEEIVEMMRRLAPAHIKPTLGWKWGGRAPKGSMSIGRVQVPTGDTAMTLTIYATEWTSRWFEFGTAERFHKSGKSVGAITPHPFFFPSWRAGRKGAKAKMRTAIRKAARDVARSG